MPATFGLIDANSFYCSCEAAFDPALKGKPVAVLSNNDGCAIARNKVVKALGLKMVDAYHLVRDRPELGEVRWFSSNYALYGDMSRRIYETLASMVPRVEPYSIDESFLDLDLPEGTDLVAYGQAIRARVLQVTKVPSCLGIGPTKTIAKLANAIAKDRPELQGICDMRDLKVRRQLYQELEVGEVWGIGRQTVAKLQGLGVETIADFMATPPDEVRDLLTVVGARVQQELRGQSCLPLAMMAATRKGLAVTRSFGRPVETWADMREAAAAHAERAAEKLRDAGLVAGRMSVFMHTNPHAPNEPWRSVSHGGRIEPTSDSRSLIREAVRMLRPLWRDGYRYSKAGILLDDLAPAADAASLFPTRDPVLSKKAMAAMDAINARFGRGTVRVASTGLERAWGARARFLSQRYTTRLDEVMVAEAW